MNKLHLLIILQLVLSYTLAEWQDPHDMTFKSNNKKLKKSTSTNQDEINSEPSQSKSSTSESQNLSSVYMKRLVGFLLQYPQLDSLNDRYEGSIKLSFTRENYDFLRQFVKLQQTSSENLRKVDAILEDVLRKSYFDASQLLTFFDKLYFSVFNKTTMILAAMTLSIFLIYKCYCQQSPFLFLLKYIILVALVVEFYVVYLDLLEEAEKQDYINEKHCDTWNDFAWSIIGQNKCKKIKVTPLQVIQRMCNTVFDTTLGAIGSGMGKYYQNALQDLPFLLKWTFGPIMFLGTLFLLVVLLTFVMNRQLNINLFHMIQFHVGKTSNESNDRSRRGRSIQMERPLIQAISNKSKKNISPKKIEYTNKSEKKAIKKNERSTKPSGLKEDKKIIEEKIELQCDIKNKQSTKSLEPPEKNKIVEKSTEKKTCDEKMNKIEDKLENN